MHISVVGKVSVGKSSFINSFYKNLCGEREWQLIAGSSIKRETFQPHRYIFGDTKDTIEITKNKNLDVFEFIDINIIPKCHIASLIDFPGFDDSGDKRDILNLIFDNMGDITIFVIDAYRPFIDKSEKEYFNRILKKSENLNKNGIFNEVIVVVNKFDYLDDIELNEMFNEMKISAKVFKWCSYASFKGISVNNSVFAEKMKNTIQKASAVISLSDINDLGLYLVNLNLETSRYKCEEINVLNKLDNREEVGIDILSRHREKHISDRVFVNYLCGHFKELPEWCFCEEKLKEISLNAPPEIVPLIVFETIIDFSHLLSDVIFFMDILKLKFSKVKHKSFAELQNWNKYHYWQLIEAFRGTPLDLPKFPKKSIEFFKIDINRLIGWSYKHSQARVNFIEFI